jgi:hypothetical protein
MLENIKVCSLTYADGVFYVSHYITGYTTRNILINTDLIESVGKVDITFGQWEPVECKTWYGKKYTYMNWLESNTPEKFYLIKMNSGETFYTKDNSFLKGVVLYDN